MELCDCRLSGWVTAVRNTPRCALSAYQAIDLLHQQIYERAAVIFGLKTKNRSSEALALISKLHGLREALVKELKGF